jgi:hypothetical protein
MNKNSNKVFTIKSMFYLNPAISAFGFLMQQDI